MQKSVFSLVENTPFFLTSYVAQNQLRFIDCIILIIKHSSLFYKIDFFQTISFLNELPFLYVPVFSQRHHRDFNQSIVFSQKFVSTSYVAKLMKLPQIDYFISKPNMFSKRVFSNLCFKLHCGFPNLDLSSQLKTQFSLKNEKKFSTKRMQSFAKSRVDSSKIPICLICFAFHCPNQGNFSLNSCNAYLRATCLMLSAVTLASLC